jgi:hypothetical protein
MGAKQLDIIGLRYNMLIVIDKLESRDYGGYKKRMWLCKCDCGNTTKVNTGALTSNKIKSCGCLTPTKSAENSIKSRYKRAKQDGGYRSVYVSYRSNAKSRNLEFNIEFDDAVKIMTSNCHYCGIEPSNIYMRSYYNVKYNGIDRVDNTIGYIKSNVVSCCKMCNIAKNNNTEIDFLNWSKRIAKHQQFFKKEIELNYVKGYSDGYREASKTRTK